MRDEAALLLEMYRVQVSRSEHYEHLRATETNLVLSIAVGLVALATFDNDLTSGDAWIGAGVFLLGLFGHVGSRLHGKRALRHGKRAAEYRNALDRMFPEARINEVRHLLPAERTRLNQVWSWLHLGIAALGGCLAALALQG